MESLFLSPFKRKIKTIISAEGAECGLACMAMIGSYYGHNIDLNGLRQRFPFSMSGATISNIMVLADQLGFSSRPIRLDLESIKDARLPAIAHWDFKHFVVLERAFRGHYIVHDPSLGRLRLPTSEFSKHFTGVLLELTPEITFSPIDAREKISLRSLWTSSEGFKRVAIQLFILSTALQILTFVAPFQIQLITDQAIGHSDLQLLTVVAVGFSALFVFQCLLSAMRAWTLQVLGNILTFQVVGNLCGFLICSWIF